MRWEQPLWPRFLPTGLVVNAATLGPIGRVPRGPGTAGTFAALIVFTVLFYGLGPMGLVLVAGLMLYAAVGICGEAESRLRRRDPSEVVLDEFAAFPLCLLGWQNPAQIYPPWLIFGAAFLLFRLLDILKPFGIARLQALPGGWGVVADDVAAALTACLLLHAGFAAATRFGWAF